MKCFVERVRSTFIPRNGQSGHAECDSASSVQVKRGAGNERAAELRSGPIDKLERDLGRLTESSSWQDRLAVAAEDRGAELTGIRDYLISSEAWLDRGLRIQLNTSSDETQQLVDELSAAKARWADITARLAGGMS